MTFLQQTLGKNYKWIYFIKFGQKVETAYRGNNFIWTFSGLFYCAVLSFTWIVATKGSSTYSTDEIVSYIIFTNIFVSLHNSWLMMTLGNRIQNGSFNQHLLQPCSFFWYQFFSYIGRSVINYFVLNLPAFLILLFIFKNIFIFQFNLYYLLITFLMIPICYFIYHSISFILGCMAFWLKQTDALNTFFYSFRNFFRGDNIPLWILILYLGNFILFTPFAFLVHHPFQIYLGKYSATEIIYTFVGGIAWCFVLWILARVIFKLGLKKNEAVGL
jgi:ABC-2 type transport system permease protein